jgi:Ca2+-binding EF-hand superfamily protein
LEDPLISLGIAESREDVKKIIDSVDDDESGQIEFKEFLTIIKNKNSQGKSGSGKDNLIIDFFKSTANVESPRYDQW